MKLNAEKVSVKIRETPTSSISFNPEEGFLRVIAKPEVEQTLETARLDFQTAKEMVEEKLTPVLADGRLNTDHTPEVRAFYASKEMAQNISAMAVLIDSLPTRIIGNFFINFNKPHFPTRLFTDIKEAEKWLRQFVKI